MSNGPLSNGIPHRVQPGETLSGIAEENGTTVDVLLALNPQITDRNRIQAGQIITIPVESDTDVSGQPSEPQPSPSSGDDGEEESDGLFLGFDRLAYPGDEFMQLLKTEGQVSWTGFYLAPAPSQGSTTWMKKRDFLKDLGFGFAPIYVGQQQRGVRGSHILTGAQGTIDAENAVELARNAGFPEESVLYLDIETGPPPELALLQYYKAWVEGVESNGFSPGVYCSHKLAADLMEQAPAIVWIFHLKFPNETAFEAPLPIIDPSQSDFTEARMIQYAQQGTLTLGREPLSPIDLDCSKKADPSEA